MRGVLILGAGGHAKVVAVSNISSPPVAVAAEPAKPPQETREAREPGAKSLKEIGGPAGPEPTRYGDWERNGRCIDF